MNPQEKQEIPGLPEEPHFEDYFDRINVLFPILQQLKNALATISNTIRYVDKQKRRSIRTLKLDTARSQHRRGQARYYSKLLLTGKWLYQSDFKPDTYVRVISLKGMIIIIPVEKLQKDDEPSYL
jgi:hypothetical protein